MSKKFINITLDKYNQLKNKKHLEYIGYTHSSKVLKKAKIPRKLKKFNPIPISYRIGGHRFYELMY